MNYKIEQIEGIGPHFAERLGAAGVHTTADLLARCATPEGREQLAQATGLSATQILTWSNQADLMRVSGIGSEYGQLLESSGVDTVKELAQRNPENLVSVMARINEEKHLTRVVPPVKTVAKWVDNARQLEPVLSH
jgi:predicted flap endonuclease-1-like 5' DNA nuclease